MYIDLPFFLIDLFEVVGFFLLVFAGALYMRARILREGRFTVYTPIAVMFAVGLGLNGVTKRYYTNAGYDKGLEAGKMIQGERHECTVGTIAHQFGSGPEGYNPKYWHYFVKLESGKELFEAIDAPLQDGTQVVKICQYNIAAGGNDYTYCAWYALAKPLPEPTMMK